MNPELALIGAALQDHRIVTASKVQPRHFGDAVLGECWRVLSESENGLSPAVIVSRLDLAGERAADLAARMVDAVTVTLAADSEAYTAAILEASERRALANVAARVQQMLDQGVELERIRSEAASLTANDADGDALAASVQTADEFVDQDLPATQWVIPDMLALGDRLILTGFEGSGKSILLRQIGLSVAAGCHPFARQPMAPSRVLIVDAENPLGIMVRKIREIRDTLRMGGFESGDRIWIHRAPGGMDLTTPKGRTVLRSLCRLVNPDLLIIGPIYKLYVPSDARDEVHARQVAAVLDELRAEHDCAVLTEHHTPMQQAGQARAIRPVGTGLWLRWPEFGFGIVPQAGTKPEDRQVELVTWRGSRDERSWPTRLQGSGTAPGRLPWSDSDNLGRPFRWAV